MSLLSFDAIRSAAENLPRTKDFEVAELGGTLRLRRLDAGQCVALAGGLDGAASVEARTEAMCRAWSHAVIGEDGEPLFPSGEAVADLGLPFGVVAQVFGEIAQLSGLFADDEVKRKAKNC